jgi:hypothetical protein
MALALGRISRRLRKIAMGAVNLFLIAYVAFLLSVIFYHYPVRVDLSSTGMNTLSDDSITCVRNLSQPVEAILSVGESDPRKMHATGRILSRAEDLLRQMMLASDKVKIIDVINIYQRGDAWLRLRERYQLTEPNRLTLICGGRRQDIRLEDMADIRYEPNGVPRILTFRVEQAVISALRRLQGEPRKIYVLRNDGSEGRVGLTIKDTTPLGYRELAAELEANNFTVKELDLKAAGAVPADCAVLLCVGLIGPLPEEVPPLVEYLERGGAFILALNPAVVDPQCLSFLQDWGFSIEPAWAVMQAPLSAVPVQTERVVATEPNPLHPITRKFDRERFRIVMAYARPVNAAKGKYAEREMIVSTAKTDNIWGERKIDERPWTRDANDYPAPITLAGVSTAERPGGTTTRIAVFGSASFLANRDLRQHDTLSLLHNTLWWILGQEELASVRTPEAIERNVAFDPEGSVQRLFAWALLGVIPGCAVLVGCAVFLIRRK